MATARDSQQPRHKAEHLPAVPERRDHEDDEYDGNGGEIIKVGSYETMLQQARAEIDSQVATAKRWPRSIAKALKEAETLACMDKEIAASCWYKLPRTDRQGNKIQGPSVRLAEIFALAWGNLRTATRVVAETDRFVVAQAAGMDLEKNVGFTSEVRRRITYADGGRYNDDMIMMTANAASSIAFRNVTFRLVPLSYVKRVAGIARAIARGEGTPIEELREQWMQFWAGRGIRPEEVFRVLEVRGIHDITIEHIDTLMDFETAVKEGHSSIDAIFRPAPEPTVEPVPQQTAKPASKSDRLAESMQREREGKDRPKGPQPAPQPPENPKA